MRFDARRKFLRVAACGVTVLMTLACDNDKPKTLWPGVASTGSPVARVFEAELWDTVATLSAKTKGGAPFGLVVLPEGFAYYDQVSQKLLGFDQTGREIRNSDNALRGQKRFREVRNVRMLRDGRLAALDSREKAIVVLSPDWTSSKRIQLSVSSRMEQFIPFGNSGFLLSSFESDKPITQVDSTGAIVTSLASPWPQYESLHPLARGGILTLGSGDSWVYAFSSGDGWLPYVGTKSRGLQHYVEPVSFPAVTERVEGLNKFARVGRVTSSAQSAAIDRGTLYVLFGGHSDLRSRLIDEYRISDGSYLKSRIAPSGAYALVTHAGKLFLFTSDSVVRVLSPRVNQ